MKKKVLVIGHADGDGHVIAEQTRRNIARINSFDVDVFVDPKLTKGHQSWLTLGEIEQIKDFEIIIFVDMMFSPSDFIKEANSVVKFAISNPSKRFFIIDHHPLPINRLYGATNIRAVYRPDVMECCIGPISGLMLLAAINERQFQFIRNLYTDDMEVVEKGLRRAAAPGGEMAGSRLLALVRNDCWEMLYALGHDDAAYHRLVRGRRSALAKKSELLLEIERVADGMVQGAISEKDRGQRNDWKNKMPALEFELERYSVSDKENDQYTNELTVSRDLEALVTLLELAALSLTESPAATFSFDDLLLEAQELAGDEMNIERSDVEIVLDKARFVKNISANVLRLR